MMPDDDRMVRFDLPQKQNDVIIKVIGVGGGGNNAVSHMYKQGIRDVSFLNCNTDKQVLGNSPVPNRLQLGEGLGAGGDPAVGAREAEKSIADIDAQLEDGTKMVFITAGMGGGTGTGAAPVIARQAMKHDILTVGIVTIPFRFEGRRKIDKALKGLEKMQENVDALLVINNQRLFEIYPDLPVTEAFGRANDVLTIAAKSIAEIITINGMVNMDFNDVRMVLKNGGVAIMSTAQAEGEGRISKAIQEALNSPLINNRDVYKSKRILMDIFFDDGPNGETLRTDEMSEIHEFMEKFEANIETKYGLATDPSLGKKVKIIILATGFGVNKLISDFNSEAPEIPDKEHEEELDGLIDIYYPGTGDGSKHRYQIFRFKEADLDNDEVIAAVSDSPTYRRQKAEVNRIKGITRALHEPQAASADSPKAGSSLSSGNVIIF